MKKLLLATALACIASTAAAQDFQADWTIQGVTYKGTAYTSLSVDLTLLPRYLSANGIIWYDNGLFFRPLDGTCVLEITSTVVCVLALDALTVSLRIGATSSGSIELLDTQTGTTLDSGLIQITSLK